MKVKIKGLVFMGFAAMIFAANAMAVDNTVTSKEYVDTKFQTKANLAQQGNETGNQLDATSDTTYPSEKMVAAALTATGATVQNGALSITVNDTTATFTANQSGDTTFSVTGLEETANKASTIDTTLSSEVKAVKYPSQAAVEAYVATQAAVSNFVEDDIQDAVTNKAPSENAVYDALLLKQDADTAVTHTANSAVGSTTIPVYIDSSGAAQPTSLGTAATANVSTTAVASDNGNLTTGTQVYDAIQAATHGNVIPEMPNTCSSTAPCVLTNSTTDGSLVWVPIQQAE